MIERRPETQWITLYESKSGKEKLFRSATFTTLAPTLAIRELPERSLFSSDAPNGNPLVARTMIEQITPDSTVRALVLGKTMARMVD